MQILSKALFVAMQCLGSGAFSLPMVLVSMGNSAYIAWILTAAGAISIGIIFIKLSGHSTVLSDVVSQALPHPKTASNVFFVIYIISTLVGNLLLLDLAVRGLQGVINISARDSLFIVFCTLLGLNALPESKTINAGLSFIKIAVMLGVPLVALFVCTPTQVTHAPITATGILKAMPITLFAFIGVESIMDGERQERGSKWGVLLGGVICLIIYLLNTYVSFNYVPDLANKIADQSLVQDFAPRLLVPFNLFLFFIGVTNINSWNLAIGTSIYEKFKDVIDRSQYPVTQPFPRSPLQALIEGRHVALMMWTLIIIQSWVDAPLKWWIIGPWIACFLLCFYQVYKRYIAQEYEYEPVKGCQWAMLLATVFLSRFQMLLFGPGSNIDCILNICSVLTGIIYALGLYGFARKVLHRSAISSIGAEYSKWPNPIILLVYIILFPPVAVFYALQAASEYAHDKGYKITSYIYWLLIVGLIVLVGMGLFIELPMYIHDTKAGIWRTMLSDITLGVCFFFTQWTIITGTFLFVASFGILISQILRSLNRRFRLFSTDSILFVFGCCFVYTCLFASFRECYLVVIQLIAKASI